MLLSLEELSLFGCEKLRSIPGLRQLKKLIIYIAKFNNADGWLNEFNYNV